MTGPCVVRLLERGPAGECSDGCALDLGHDGACLDSNGQALNVVSAKAFETLEGVRDYVETRPSYLGNSYDDVKPAGGSVSLPDGREIAVEQTTWDDIAAVAWPTVVLGASVSAMTRRALLEAFNAKENARV